MLVPVCLSFSKKKLPFLITAAVLSMSSTLVHAQAEPREDVRSQENAERNGAPPSRAMTPGFKLDMSGIYHADSELDSGSQNQQAQLQRNSWAVKLSASSALNQTLSFGANIGYEKKQYDWSGLLSSSNTLGLLDTNVMPWQSADFYTLGVSLSYRPNNKWMFLLSPQVKYAYADTSSASDAQSYGAVVSAMYRFASGNMLGLGVAYLNDLDEVKTVPYLAVRWQISDKWLLSNPFKAGFSGPAGLELSYKASDKLDVGFGVSRRSEVFAAAYVPNSGTQGREAQSVGIQEWVSFIRASWQLTPSLELSGYGGYIFGGEMEIEPQGIAYDLAGQAATGLNLSISF
jgi:hypothetical protein